MRAAVIGASLVMLAGLPAAYAQAATTSGSTSTSSTDANAGSTGGTGAGNATSDAAASPPGSDAPAAPRWILCPPADPTLEEALLTGGDLSCAPP